MGVAEDPTELWVDDHAGPVVRPYAMTRGRTQPSRGRFNMISLVLATGVPASIEVGMGPEHLAIVQMCQRPLSVAEIAAHLDLPLGTVRVLLGDLLERKLIQVRDPQPATSYSDGLPDNSVFEAAINGLRAL